MKEAARARKESGKEKTASTSSDAPLSLGPSGVSVTGSLGPLTSTSAAGASLVVSGNPAGEPTAKDGADGSGGSKFEV